MRTYTAASVPGFTNAFLVVAFRTLWSNTSNYVGTAWNEATYAEFVYSIAILRANHLKKLGKAKKAPEYAIALAVAVAERRQASVYAGSSVFKVVVG